MGHHDDRVVALELTHELLDLCRGDGIKGARRLVHEQHLGLNGQGARDAQTLLLATRQTQGVLLQAILELVPNGGLTQGLLHDAVEFLAVADAMGARAKGHVVVDAHGEGVGLLEHHAHAAAQLGGGHAVIGIVVVERDLALDAAALNEVVHAVERLEQGRLAAARRADEGRHLVGREVEVDVLERMEVAVVQVETLDAHLRWHGCHGNGRARGTLGTYLPHRRGD